MKRFTVLTLAVLPLLFACASNVIYHPASKPERVEINKDLLDVYPGDIRSNPNMYTNTGVGWAGIITSTDARVGRDGMIHAVTTFEHHYFDWQEEHGGGEVKVSLSPRGEGTFRTEWVLRRDSPDADAAMAENYASPGKLAIVYGVPERVENETVILRYRYLRVIPQEDYSTNVFDYGRFGEPFRYIGDLPGLSNY